MGKFKCPVAKGNSDTQRSSYQRRKNTNSSFSFQHLPIPPWHKDRRDALAMAPGLNFCQNYWCPVWSPCKDMSSSGMFSVSMSHSARSAFTDSPEGPGKGCLGALGLYFGFQFIKQNCSTFSCGTGHRTEFRLFKSAAKRLIFVPFQKVMLTDRGKNGFVLQADDVFPQENQIFKHHSSFWSTLALL